MSISDISVKTLTHIDDHIATFTKDKQKAFVDWVVSSGGSNRAREWTDARLLDYILLIMVTKKYKTVFDIKMKDFTVNKKRVEPYQKPQFNRKHSGLITYVSDVFAIELGEGEFRIIDKAMVKEQRKSLVALPEFTGTDHDHRIANDVKVLLSSVPGIVNDMCVDLMACALELPDDELKFLGVVYVMYLLKTRQVIYVGSTDNFKERTKNHKTDFQSTKKDSYVYTYMKINGYEFDKDVSFLIVAKCPAGYDLEKLIEAEFYDALKRNQTVHLIHNNMRPVSKDVTINSKGYIYRFVNIHTDTCIYIGKSVKPYDRLSSHKSRAYNKSESATYNSSLYVAARAMNNERWPDEYRFEVIEAMPVWLQMQRESHYINLHNTIYEGYNVASVVYYNTSKPVCRFCNKEFSCMARRNHHHIICKKNPAPPELQKFPCQFCDKPFTFKIYLEKHTKRCPKRPSPP